MSYKMSQHVNEKIQEKASHDHEKGVYNPDRRDYMDSLMSVPEEISTKRVEVYDAAWGKCDSDRKKQWLRQIFEFPNLKPDHGLRFFLLSQ